MNEPAAVSDTQRTSQPSASYAFLLVCAAFMITGIMVLAWLGTKPKSKIEGKLFPILKFDPITNASKPISTNDFLGSKTALLLWVPTSKTCQERLEKLSQFSRSHPEWKLSTVAFLEQGGFDVDTLSTQVQQFLQSNQLDWPVYVDSLGKATVELTLLMPYGSFGFPTLLLIDERGQLVQIIESQDEEAWKNLVESLR